MTQEEQDFAAKALETIPESSVVINNPGDGSLLPLWRGRDEVLPQDCIRIWEGENRGEQIDSYGSQGHRDQ